jgi:hypothetical protein
MRGNWNMSLTATNGEGNSTKYQVIKVMRYYQGIIPGAIERNPLMVNCEDRTYTTSREITDMERIRTDEKIAGVCHEYL